MFNQKREREPPFLSDYRKRCDLTFLSASGQKGIFRGSNLFLIWGITVLLNGCSLDIAPSRAGLGFLTQITQRIEAFSPSFIHLSSNSSPMRPVSVDDPTPPEPIPRKNEIPSDKPQQQVPASQEQKPAILVPDIPNKDNGQVIVTYKAKIDETQNLLRTINESQLSKEQHDTYVSINSFLEKAQEAFSQNDLSMALNLSEKAHTLTKEIVNNSTKP